MKKNKIVKMSMFISAEDLGSILSEYNVKVVSVECDEATNEEGELFVTFKGSKSLLCLILLECGSTYDAKLHNKAIKYLDRWIEKFAEPKVEQTKEAPVMVKPVLH